MKFLFVLAALVGSASAQCVGLPTMAYTPTTAPTDDGAGNYAAGQVFEVVLNSACASGYWGATGATSATTTIATCTDGWAWDNGDPTGCTAWTVCTAAQYESAAGTATADRTCADLTVCTAAQYETVVATATSDRTCTALTVCTGTQYETVAATATSDRTCADLTVCTGTQYESAAATATSDRTCMALTVCGTAEMETDAPSATTNRVCGWKTCADAGEDLRVRGVDGNADPDVNPAAVTVDRIVPQVSCLCGANQEGLLGVVPGTKTLVQTCADSEAGAVEHEMTVTFTVDFSFADYSNSATKAEVDATAAAALWAASGLEAVHVKFQNAAENADNDQHTDVNFKLIFASESWALDTTGAIDQIPLASLSPLTKFLSVSYTTPSEVVLDGAAHSGVGVLAAAVVATALLL